MKKNAIVGQSGGPTAVINASLYGVVYEALNREDVIGTIYGMINGIEGFLNENMMDMKPLEVNGELELIKTTPYDRIDIIPCNGYLMNTNMYLMKTEEGNQILRLAEDLEDVAAAYDYCVIDCGLIMDMTVMNALVAADLVIVPVKLGGFEIEAADNMDEQLESIRKFNDRIRMKVLITMRQKNKTTLQVEEWLKENSGHDCFRTVIRRSVVAEKSTIAHVPLPKFSKGCIASQDYRAVTYELLRDLEGGQDE